MKTLFAFTFLLVFFSCANDNNTASASTGTSTAKNENAATSSAIDGFYEGPFTNGMKETFISFQVFNNGTELKDLTFKGYWRCDGKLELTKMGPEGKFAIVNGKVKAHITQPEGGGATATRFELLANFSGNSAEGHFRMNINALNCDTYNLNWKANKVN